jgi:hypothetical protein
MKSRPKTQSHTKACIDACSGLNPAGIPTAILALCEAQKALIKDRKYALTPLAVFLWAALRGIGIQPSNPR